LALFSLSSQQVTSCLLASRKCCVDRMRPPLTLAQSLTQSGFNRAQESAADEFALDLVHREYGHLGGAFDFFRKDTAGGGGRMAVSWLSTHPSSDDRIERLENLARQRGWGLDGAKRPAVRLNQ